MTFLAPWFLIGMLAAAIPLLLHLRRSRQTRPILFSCTRFFDEQFLKATRRARVQDLLLMMLRMALLALLALALAQPLLKSGPLAGLLTAGQARRVVIVLDDSASMARHGLFDTAKAQARAILDDLSPARGDAVSLILGGYRETGPAVVFEQVTTDLAAVRRAIDATDLTDLATDLNGAIAQASKVLSSTDAGEILVVSDLQATAFAADLIASPGPRASIAFIACSEPGDTANASVDAVQVGSSRPMIGVPFTFRALITNHGDRSRNTRVQLVVNDAVVATRTVDLAPARGQVVRFVHRFDQQGWQAGRIELDPLEASDALPLDDRRHFVVHVEQRLRVLAINGAPSSIAHQDELFFVNAALAAGRTDQRGVHVDTAAPDRITPELLAGYPVVILANAGGLTEPARLAVERHVDQGGSVLATLGDRVDRAALNQWAGLLPGTIGDLAENAAISAIDDTHPALAGLAAGGLRAARIDRYFAVAPHDAAVLMATSNGSPLLLEKRLGAGRVLLWTSTIDRDWNDLPLQPTFLPWMYRVLTYLAQPALDRGTFALTGDSVPLPTSLWSDAMLQVKLPDGATAYPSPDPAGGIVLHETQQAGIYRVIDARNPAAGDSLMFFAVNIDPQESRPQALNEPDIGAAIAPEAAWAYVPYGGDRHEASLQSARGSGLWDMLLVVALVVAITEPWLANRISRRRRSSRNDVAPVESIRTAA